jgi:hypothetical protein
MSEGLELTGISKRCATGCYDTILIPKYVFVFLELCLFSVSTTGWTLLESGLHSQQRQTFFSPCSAQAHRASYPMGIGFLPRRHSDRGVRLSTTYTFPTYSDNRFSYVIEDVCLLFIFSRVRGSVTTNNGFWIGRLDLLALLLQLHLITITYKSSRSATAKDSLHSLLDYERLLFHGGWQID